MYKMLNYLLNGYQIILIRDYKIFFYNSTVFYHTLYIIRAKYA